MYMHVYIYTHVDIDACMLAKERHARVQALEYQVDLVTDISRGCPRHELCDSRACRLFEA